MVVTMNRRDQTRRSRRGWVVGIALVANAALHAQTTGSTVGSEQIVQGVERYLHRELANHTLASGAQRIEVRAGALDSRLQLADCGRMQFSADLSPIKSRVNVRVSCGGTQPWGLYVPATVSIYQPVVVAARNLSRGDTVEATDVTLDLRNILAPGTPALQEAADAIGKKVRRTIAQDIEITGNLLEEPILVRRGDNVKLTSWSGPISVRTEVKALGNGREGERIRVKNPRSDKVVQAIVSGPGEVMVVHRGNS